VTAKPGAIAAALDRLGDLLAQDGTFSDSKYAGLDAARVELAEMHKALEAVEGWASDTGPLKGKSPMDVAEYCRAARGAKAGA